ncbi:hypothetical protein ACFT5B_04040 [Luteimicrobium sp. NPDC057192]|uniref:hypothetical protein n=1 Tax=Luteimicrobium sp. NPDC057192 TaxID=3346042 RepID=UPI00362D4C75
MRIDLTFDEARILALHGQPLPPVLTSLTCEDDTVYATVDLRKVPNPPAALRFAVALTPTVHAALRYESFADGVLDLRATATAAGLPVQRLLGFVEGPLRAALVKQGLPPDAVTLVTGDGDPIVRVRVAEVLAQRAPGLHVTALTFAGGRIVVDGAVDPSFRLA